MTEETTSTTKAAEPTLAQVIAEPTNAVNEANTTASPTNDPLTAGLQQAVNIAGVADKTEKVYGEKVKPEDQAKVVAAPTAAPIQQIAPVSANGEQTSSREAPKAEMPAEIPLVSQPAGVSSNINPSADPSAQPPVQEAPVPTPEAPAEVAFEDLSPLEQADNLLNQVPGRFRIY